MRPVISISAALLLGCIAGCSRSPLSTPSPVQPAGSQTGTPPVPPADPAAQYTLSVDLGSLGPECARVPDSAKHRTYAAAIASQPDGSEVVSLSAAIFLIGSICTAASSGLSCNQFPVASVGDSVRFTLVNDDDAGHGGHIVERIPGTGWIELTGDATSPTNADPIAATGQGNLWFCSQDLTYPFPCANFVGCAVKELRMNLARR